MWTKNCKDYEAYEKTGGSAVQYRPEPAKVPAKNISANFSRKILEKKNKQKKTALQEDKKKHCQCFCIDFT